MREFCLVTVFCMPRVLMHQFTLGTCFVLLCTALACGDASTRPADVEQLPRDGNAYFPTSAWRSADPNAVGMQASRLNALSEAIAGGGYAGVNSLIIVRHGYLITERYFNGTSATTSQTVQSVTKSVTSLLAGIAIDKGHLTANARVLTVLPQYQSLANMDARKGEITLRHLLEMRSGINFYESPYEGSPLQRLNTSADDWTRLALAEPMNANPGALWQYNSGGVIAVGAMIRRAVGGDFYKFARDNLFIPIGVTSQLWVYSPFDTLPHTGGGLRLNPLDLTRIGYMVLRRGRWNGIQIVSEAWLNASLARISNRPATLGGHVTDYGLLWWLMPLDARSPSGGRDDTIWMASGNLNNWLFIVPKHDLVVVVTGSDNRSFGAPVDFLYREILPAVVLP
jgi:CubicO group peptidase (beta-lactamase class C family)